MPIQTTVTIDDTFQVLDSQVAAPPGSTVGQYFEEGSTNLPINSNVVNVTFGTVKISTAYTFTVLNIRNSTDPTPQSIDVEITSKNTSGFQALISAVPDTSNYWLDWGVLIPTS